MKRRLVALVLVLAVAGAVGGYAYTRRARPPVPGTVRVSGNLEVTEVQLSFRVAGWVKARPAAEGQTLTAGAAVAELDATELGQQVALSQAAVEVSAAALAEAVAGARPEEIGQAEAAAQRAAAAVAELAAGARPAELAAAAAATQAAGVEAVFLTGELERAKGLRASGVIPAQELAAAESRAAGAAARLREVQARETLVKDGPRREALEQARAAWRGATEQLALVRQGPRQEVIDQARARLAQAEAGLAVAQTRLGYATLTAPTPGVVLSEGIQAGEYVMPGTPVVTLGDVAHPWLRAYINETDLGRVKLGQRVAVTTDTYPGQVYGGVVAFIASAAEFTPKNVQTEKERVKLVYRIKVELANPNAELKPGMPADGVVLTGP